MELLKILQDDFFLRKHALKFGWDNPESFLRDALNPEIVLHLENEYRSHNRAIPEIFKEVVN